MEPFLFMSRLSWEEYFLLQTITTKCRSQDKFRQVGAICIGKNNRLLSTGYNGVNAGFEPPDGLYEDRENPLRETITTHAEMNALLLCKPGEVHTIYCTCSPCKNCAKLIVTHGVKNVFYLEEYHRESDYKTIFDFYNVKFSKIKKQTVINVISQLDGLVSFLWKSLD